MGKQIAIVVGHEPGGGAAGERGYNLSVQSYMDSQLRAAGFDVFCYTHFLKPYGARQTAMAAAVKKAQPQNLICVELHYNDVDTALANGHQFHYNASKGLAVAFAKEWQKTFPGSRARQDKGTLHTPSGDGAGFLIKSPGLAVLVEPFFRSNAVEWTFFRNKHEEVAAAYSRAITNFVKNL